MPRSRRSLTTPGGVSYFGVDTPATAPLPVPLLTGDGDTLRGMSLDSIWVDEPVNFPTLSGGITPQPPISANQRAFIDEARNHWREEVDRHDRGLISIHNLRTLHSTLRDRAREIGINPDTFFDGQGSFLHQPQTWRTAESVPITATEAMARFEQDYASRIIRNTRPRPNRPTGPDRGRQFEPPAWKKFPCLLNSDRRQTGKTTKLIEEMLTIDGHDCLFLSFNSSSLTTAKNIFKEQCTKKRISYSHTIDAMFARNDSGQTYSFRVFNLDLFPRVLRGTSDRAVFIDNLDLCLKGLFEGHTIVTSTWNIEGQ